MENAPTRGDLDVDETLTASGPRRSPRLARALTETKIGRFHIIRHIGTGGMGVVYAAYDPQLDRKVALKFLRQTAGESSERFRREAHALARLSHPNVVQIYDSGTHDDAPYLAMEFIAGQTLRSWLRRAPRSYTQILAIYIAAGRGLAAAHEQGLIHRDFKPDNVMVTDSGEVKVMDFGLARLVDVGEVAGEDAPSNAASSTIDTEQNTSEQLSPSSELTAHGTVIGTPAYMAPEQIRGQIVDARSDQYSFCIALWAALYGSFPFAGRDWRERTLAMIAQRIEEPPRDTDVPAWMRRVLERGLTLDPNARWPSLAQLLDTLEDDPTLRRRARWTRVAGVGLPILAFTAWQASSYAAEARAEREAQLQAQAQAAQLTARCERESLAVQAIWSEEVRARSEQHFQATNIPFATRAWQRTRELVDAWTEEWSERRRELCLASGPQTDANAELEQAKGPLDVGPSLSARSSACLDERSASLAAVTEQLERLPPDSPEVLARSVTLAAQLPSIESCFDPASLQRRTPPPPDSTQDVLAIRVELERGRIHIMLGQLEAADVAIARAEALAQTLDWAPLLLEVRLERAMLEIEQAHNEAGREQLEQVFLQASKEGADAVAASAAVRLTWVTGFQFDEHELGLLWGELAEVFIIRAKLEHEELAAWRLFQLGLVHKRAGDLDRALSSYEQSLALYDAKLGADHPEQVRVLNSIGTIYRRRGEYETAIEFYSRGLEIRERILGTDHPLLSYCLSGLGSAYRALGQRERALEYLERAIAVWEGTYGPMHKGLGPNYNNIGNTYRSLGRNDEAERAYSRSLEIMEATLPPGSRNISHPLSGLAQLALLHEDFERAGELLERVLAIREATKAHPVEFAEVHFGLAQVYWARGERSRARELARQARAEQLESGVGDSNLEQIEAWLAEH